MVRMGRTALMVTGDDMVTARLPWSS
jgi:hypothetical protein